MNHGTWRDHQAETTLAIEGADRGVAYYDAGDGEETLVFLHGIPTWSFLWRRIAPAFTDEYRVLAPDLLGYGYSDRREGFDRSVRTQETMLEAFLDDLGLDTVTLVAHDIGGAVALRVAAHAPDRVDRLVLSNAACYDSWPVEFVVNMGLPGTADMADEEFEGQLDFAFGEGTYDDADPAFVEGMKAPWLRADGKRALARAAVSTNTNHTTEIPYGDVDAAVCCLWGADDAMQPIQWGERLADDLGGRLVPLEGAYHWVVEDRPDAYREELETFLADAPEGG